MSGYDIRRFLKSLGSLLGAPSFSAIYPALHALLEDGLATVEVVSRPDKPPRKIYTITEAGAQALQEWVAQPVASSAKLKSFVMHLMLVGDLSHAGLFRHLQQRRETVAVQQSTLEQTIQELGERAGRGQRLALELGLATTSAELAWLDGELAQFGGDPEADQPVGITRGGKARQAR
jgi:DNA-binding PadR family transcriptional regulator